MGSSADFSSLEGYLRRCAEIMSADRSDLWPTPVEALDTLERWNRHLTVDSFDAPSSVSSGSFQLSRRVDDYGFVEYNLDRHVLDYFAEDGGDGEASGFDWDLVTNRN